MKTRTIAIMQPYFMPYAGYFRLMAAADVFVIYDSVQFPKGGWVHRNRLPGADGELKWLTLPIQRPNLGTTIQALEFMPDPAAVMRTRLQAFPEILSLIDTDPLVSQLMSFDCRPIDYLVRQLETVCVRLGLLTRFVRASSLPLPLSKDAAERVIEIVKHLEGDTYVNAPGGRGLYDKDLFSRSGVELHFLIDYPGSNVSILQRLLHEDSSSLREEILAATRYQDG